MPEALKNRYNEAYVTALTRAIEKVEPNFDSESFVHHIFDSEWENRELKERMRHITHCLYHFLSNDYSTALPILRQAGVDKSLQNYSFENMIFPDFVEVYGLEDWDNSLPALEQFTQLASAEFAVRPFIIQNSEHMMAQMLQWASHENYHIRRLASEGSRPRLPWAMALPQFKKDPSPILPILELLKNDESDYVTRSVSNNLNDITKDNPQVVLDLLAEWQKNSTKSIQWITSHALRTLIKAGNNQALALLGYSKAQVKIANFKITPETIAIGEEIEFSFDLISESDSPQSLIVDYTVHFVRANDSRSAKVFKLKNLNLAPFEQITVHKKYSFKIISTRRYYAGTHIITLQVNGNVSAENSFDLR